MASLACGASAAHAVMSGLSDGAFTRLNTFGARPMSGREPTPTFRMQSDLFHSVPVMRRSHAMKAILPLFTIAYATVALLFPFEALAVMGFAVMGLWDAIGPREGQALAVRAANVIESIGLLAVSLVGLEMAQTVVEEEVVRRVHVSAPARVRRYLSRFLVVVVIALAIESLVAVVQALHEQPETLPQAASVSVGAATLLAAWGVFVRLNRTECVGARRD